MHHMQHVDYGQTLDSWTLPDEGLTDRHWCAPRIYAKYYHLRGDDDPSSSPQSDRIIPKNLI